MECIRRNFCFVLALPENMEIIHLILYTESVENVILQRITDTASGTHCGVEWNY